MKEALAPVAGTLDNRRPTNYEVYQYDNVTIKLKQDKKSNYPVPVGKRIVFCMII
jgi:hypothetical protein